MDLTGARLDGANCTDALMVGANLTRATLDGADFTRADLTRATLDGPLDGSKVTLGWTRVGMSGQPGADLLNGPTLPPRAAEPVPPPAKPVPAPQPAPIGLLEALAELYFPMDEPGTSWDMPS